MDKIAELEVQVARLEVQLSSLVDDMQYADGLAYSQTKQRVIATREELFLAQNQLRALTVCTVELPEHVRAERARERVEKQRKARIDAFFNQH